MTFKKENRSTASNGYVNNNIIPTILLSLYARKIIIPLHTIVLYTLHIITRRYYYYYTVISTR